MVEIRGTSVNLNHVYFPWIISVSWDACEAPPRVSHRSSSCPRRVCVNGGLPCRISVSVVLNSDL